MILCNEVFNIYLFVISLNYVTKAINLFDNYILFNLLYVILTNVGYENTSIQFLLYLLIRINI